MEAYQACQPSTSAARDLLRQYESIRAQSLNLCRHLNAEDMTAQSMADASPTKWHLAHTTWFFETFLLLEQPNSALFNAEFQQLFNSYYVTVGQPFRRPQRGFITRPTVADILAYRAYVDEHMQQCILQDDAVAERVIIGLHHEMQHQELILTDLLHLFSHNPLYPAAIAEQDQHSAAEYPSHAGGWIPIDAQLIEVGAEPTGFSYDCEKPRHTTYLNSARLASRPINNGEWIEFINDGGYQKPLLWLSDGWAICQQHAWQAPGYWLEQDQQWWQFGLDGLKPVTSSAPVCHISYYEAQAFATWAGYRLPWEQELEYLARQQPIVGNFVENQVWRPQSSLPDAELQQIYGDVWEWTQSAYSPYPGFRPEQGALGEYNGKFMCNQFVLRGGSCVTPQQQLRPSYRNFFYPHQRWQFSGLRLAADN